MITGTPRQKRTPPQGYFERSQVQETVHYIEQPTRFTSSSVYYHEVLFNAYAPTINIDDPLRVPSLKTVVWLVLNPLIQ
jgi:hypothetical protein